MEVTVYSTESCSYCVSLKQWLDNKDVKYTDYKVDKNPYAAQMMVNESGQGGVPFTTIKHKDGTVDKILGFDRNQIEQSLARQ